jgi:hypothetical protein
MNINLNLRAGYKGNKKPFSGRKQPTDLKRHAIRMRAQINLTD